MDVWSLAHSLVAGRAFLWHIQVHKLTSFEIEVVAATAPRASAERKCCVQPPPPPPLSIFFEDRMLLPGAWRIRYSPARDVGHSDVIAGSDGAHFQGVEAGVFENYMREGRGQQPLWPSAEEIMLIQGS